MNQRYNFDQQLNFVLKLFALLTVVEILNLLTGRQLNQFALVPREFDAAIGILFSPFLHGSLWHYTSNIVPICLFSLLVMQYGIRCFWQVTATVFIGTGILVWLFGRDAFHLGASGVVYGYFGFLLYAGFLSGRIRLMLMSILVGFFYGGLIFGIFPIKGYVSWESHLFGFFMGLVSALIFVKKVSKTNRQQ